MPRAFRDLIACGVLASAREPFDPMEKAFHALARRGLTGSEAMTGSDWTLARTYALRSEFLAMSQAWNGAGVEDDLVVAAKGAPEAIAELCRMTPEARVALSASIDAMAAAGLRVLGVARASFRGSELPHSQRISVSTSSDWSGSPIRCARACQSPLPNAVPLASKSS